MLDPVLKTSGYVFIDFSFEKYILLAAKVIKK